MSDRRIDRHLTNQRLDLTQLDLRELEERLEVSPLNVLGEIHGSDIEVPEEPLSCGWKIPICRIVPSTGPTDPDPLS